MALRIKIPDVSEPEKTPLVSTLLEITYLQKEHIQALEDEIARLKGNNPRPDRKPSLLEKKSEDATGEMDNDGKRPGSAKRSKTGGLEIHKTIPIRPTNLPEGSTLCGTTQFTVQDILLQPCNICYELEHWRGPDGTMHVGEVPTQGRQGHFGSTLIRFILYQYYHAHVTQPLIYEQLRDIGVDISTGQVNRLITEEKEPFHKEKESLLVAGLAVSQYINTDDTGARHKGKNFSTRSRYVSYAAN